MGTILVTGGAGFIGSHICDELLSRGDKVVCVDNFNDYYDPDIKEKNIENASKNENFFLFRVDITDKGAMQRVFEEHMVDKVVHVAARAGVRASFEKPELYEKVNVKGTRVLLELLVKYKIKNFIFGSSSSVYGLNKKVPFSEQDSIDNTISPYATTKKKAEALCKTFHDTHRLNVTCLRFFTCYGPRGRPDMAPYKFTRLISQEKPIEMYGDGTSKRDYTYVSDIVSGVLSALDKDFDFEIINLGDSNPIELRHFISLIEKEVGKKSIINSVPMQKGDVPITFADISRAQDLLGYNPKVKIKEGIKLLVGWYRNER